MTVNKRFEECDGIDGENNPIKTIRDNWTTELYSMWNDLEANSVCIKLNSLADENEYLKFELKRTENQVVEMGKNNVSYIEEISELEDENEYLKKQLRIFEDALKAEIRETKIAIEDWHEVIEEKRKLKLENESLEKENQGIQDKVMRLLDYVAEKKCITRNEIKEWWNGE